MNHKIQRKVIMMRAGREKQRGMWDAIESLDDKMNWLNERISQIDKRLGKHTIKSDERFRLNDERFKLWFERSDLERKEMEARISADRKDAAERLAAEWKKYEAEKKERDEKFAVERKEFQQERKEAMQEFDSQKRWLKATFAAVLVGVCGIFTAIVIQIVQLI